MGVTIKQLRIIRPSGRERIHDVDHRVSVLKAMGFKVTCPPARVEPDAPSFHAGSILARTSELVDALEDPQADILMPARGGYGASDLLAKIPFARLRQRPPKLIVGFSDTTALQSALFAQLGWRGLHGPMVLGDRWSFDGPDVQHLLKLLSGEFSGGTIRVTAIDCDHCPDAVHGWLFGGNIAVLSNLIGTPYFPGHLDGAIVFLEDVGEAPGRILRYFNQWVHSGLIGRAQAVIIGQLTACTGDLGRAGLLREIARRSPIRVFSSPDFGHESPNFPLGIGDAARLEADRLVWGAAAALAAE